MKLRLGYPAVEDGLDILEDQRESHPIDNLQPVASLEEIIDSQRKVRQVRVERPVSLYILLIADESRKDARLRLGVSPRGCLALYRACQALALSSGRDHVLPDDVKEMAPYVLPHRLVLDTRAKYSGVLAESVIAEILGKVKVPT
jgi:MoxR-like ATPase